MSNSCNSCQHKENKRCTSRGNPGAEIVFVGDFPKEIEIANDQIFNSIGGRLLLQTLKVLKKDPQECFYSNLCMCLSATTSKAIIAQCRKRLLEEMMVIRPKVIFALGTLVSQILLNTTAKIEEIQGTAKWVEEFGCYVMPVIAPGILYHDPSKLESFQSAIRKGYVAVDWPHGGKPPHVVNAIVPETGAEAMSLLRDLKMLNNWQSCDIETAGFNFTTMDILSIGFAPNANDGIVFGKDLIEHKEIQLAIEDNFGNPLNKFGFQNGKFDGQYMKFNTTPVFKKQKKVVIRNVRNDFDTMLAHYCIDERQGTHGLKVWAKEYFDAPDWDSGLKIYLPNKDTSYEMIPPKILYKYQAYDLCYTYLGIDLFTQMMIEEGTYGLFTDILMPAANALADIEMRGVRVDRDMLNRLFDEMDPKLKEAKKNLEKAAFAVGFTPERYQQETGAKEKPKFFNPNSHPQMSYVAYNLCQMPLFGGKKTCNKDAVEIYQHRHPFWKTIAEYKQINDLFGIYVKGMLERLDEDGFVRPDFFLHGTVTGRLSCHDPNLQNIPRKSFVKDLFIADEDTVIVSADYKTLEVVVAAILSDDPVMKAPFLAGEDYHTTTMMSVFGDQIALMKHWVEMKDFEAFDNYLHQQMMMEMRNPGTDYLYTKIDKDDPTTWIKKPIEDIRFDKLYDLLADFLRFLTKFITFGIMYGRKAKSLAEGELNCSINNAQLYINNFFKRYPDFKAWQGKMISQAKKEGYVQNPFGFKRRWKNIDSDAIYLLENQAVNTPIQGTASYICLKALTKIHNAFLENLWGWVLFTVHDSIVSEVKKVHLKDALHLIQSKMEEKPFETEVPFVADLEIGQRYGKVEGITFEEGKWVPAKPEKASQWLKDTLASL
jgi:uracil-DNA glycosylase family 4